MKFITTATDFNAYNRVKRAFERSENLYKLAYIGEKPSIWVFESTESPRPRILNHDNIDYKMISE
jgi:hypothetical protein